MVLEEIRQQKWQDYTATAMWMLGKFIGRDHWGMQPYMEFAYRTSKADEQTPEQIKAHILRRFAE